ncbi:unnamed protein product [Closterium sp. NIES-65]|nr:unnamed protein product [Closterium sp. NIES-65]
MPSFLSSSQLQSHRSATSLPTTGILRSAGWDDSSDKLEEEKRRLLRKLKGQEYLLSRVTAGRLALPDGGAKLSAQVRKLHAQLQRVESLLAAHAAQQAAGDADEQEADSASVAFRVSGRRESGGGNVKGDAGAVTAASSGVSGMRGDEGEAMMGRMLEDGADSTTSRVARREGEMMGGDSGAAGEDGMMRGEGGVGGVDRAGGEGRMAEVVEEGVGDSSGLVSTVAVAAVTVTTSASMDAAGAAAATSGGAAGGAEGVPAGERVAEGAERKESAERRGTQQREGDITQRKREMYMYRDTAADSQGDSTGSLLKPSMKPSSGPGASVSGVLVSSGLAALGASVRTRTSSFQPSCSSAAMRRLWSLHRAVETTIDDPALEAAGRLEQGGGAGSANGIGFAGGAVSAGNGGSGGREGSAGSAGTRVSLPAGSSAPRVGSDGRMYRLHNGKLERVGADEKISPEGVQAAREKVRRDLMWEADRAAVRLGRVLKIGDGDGDGGGGGVGNGDGRGAVHSAQLKSSQDMIDVAAGAAGGASGGASGTSEAAGAAGAPGRCARVISVLEAAQLLAEQRTRIREYEEKIMASAGGGTSDLKRTSRLDLNPPDHDEGAWVEEDPADDFEDDDALDCEDGREL